MNRIRRIALAAMGGLAVLGGGCATPPPQYAGNDAGQMVIGIGARADSAFDEYSFYLRPINNRSADAVRRLLFSRSQFLNRHGATYDNPRESGAVLVTPLAPGQYELFDFEAYAHTGGGVIKFRSVAPLSIPFRVETGRAVYLGNYQANDIGAKVRDGYLIPAGVLFHLTDRIKAETAPLQQQGALPPVIDNATPNAATLKNNPAFTLTPPQP